MEPLPSDGPRTVSHPVGIITVVTAVHVSDLVALYRLSGSSRFDPTRIANLRLTGEGRIQADGGDKTRLGPLKENRDDVVRVLAAEQTKRCSRCGGDWHLTTYWGEDLCRVCAPTVASDLDSAGWPRPRF